jgi:LacI family transcriptional regulator
MAESNLKTRYAGVRSRAVTIEDVARLAGTSKGTASRALNGKHWVAEPTREAVIKAASELGFHADPTAQRLANGRCANLVGLFARTLDLGVVTRKLQLLQIALNAAGYEAPIHACGNDHLNTGRQAAALASLCREKPAAIVCYTLELSDTTLRELQLYCDAGGVVVCFDTPFDLKSENGDFLLFDRDHNTYEATRHLVDLGHRKIGFFASGISHDPNRLRGFKRALREGGLAWSDECSFFGEQYKTPGETILLSEIFGQRMAEQFCRIPVRERPSAMCITDDYVAAAFIAEIMRRGLRVPRDVSVVGHDDMPVAAYACAVPLTTASQPVEQIASETERLLRTRLNGEYTGKPRRVVVKGELVIRESTAPYNGNH